MAEVNVYDAKGSAKGKVSLPEAFDTPVRSDLIRKAVQAARANRRQAYGANRLAGRRHATASAGKGKGVSRVPRLTQGNAAALAPPNVGGRRAHPPEARRDWTEKINRKERRLAIRSALAATADVELVKARGHRFDEGVTLPLVLSDDAGALTKTKDVIALLEKLGVADDLARARNGRRERPGIGKLRGRRYKTPRSLLLVTHDPANGRRGFGNLTGVDVASPAQLSAEDLAPGGDHGRLVVYTESALKALGGEN